MQGVSPVPEVLKTRLKGAWLSPLADTLDVISKSIDLMKYTIQITSNHKRYPKKFLILIQKIQSTSLEIYDALMEANRLQLQLNTEKAERLKLQTKAITLCDELSCFIQLSMDLSLIGSDTVEYWQKKISDIKYMTIAWRSKDKAR